MPINPKIIEKIESLTIPDKVKQFITEALETEDYLEATATQKQSLKSYDKLLDKFAANEDVIKFCDSYGK